MAFADDLRRFATKTEAQVRDVFVGTAVHLHTSIKFGSPVTGAPGQPIDLGTLRNSWTLTFESPDTALIASNIEYAQAVEDGVGPYGPRVYGAKNGLGGSHSVKISIAAAQRVVDAEVARVRGLAGGAA